MATTRYFLKDEKIMLRYSHEGETTQFYSKERIKPKLWDKKNNRVKFQAVGAADINRNLDKLQDNIKKLIRDREFAGESLSAKDIKEAYEQIKNPDKAKEKTDLIFQLEQYIKANPKKLSENTLFKYQSLLYHLKNYKELGNEVSFKTINNEFAADFRDYLNSEDEKTKKTIVTDNSVVAYYGAFGSFLKLHGVKFNYDINLKEREKVVIFLTLEEIKAIQKLIIEEGSELDKVRDLYLFGCFTGMRFGDIQKLHKANIRDGFIIYSATKTENETIVPINQYSKPILGKYDYKFPQIDNKQANKILRKLAKLAELNEETIQIRYTGNKRNEVVLPKNELLTFHTGRSSFIMACLSKGYGFEVIKAMTGHKDFRSFQKYVRISKPMLKDVSKVVFG